ncbi:MAG TPA: FKBP-type peptidyl-prolyl cis-trans isomerase, partial [Archangium sp.]|nr:FKBP-type peptidyl-prolyl cis-trans isomerase [Archangium sp.]
VQKMKPGGKAKLTCPPAIAYGSRGAGNVIPPDALLTFEIELLGIQGQTMPGAPAQGGGKK